MNDDDFVNLDDDDFRATRRYLAPHLFFWGDNEVTSYPAPDDIIAREKWEGLMDLPTDVALRSTSWHGSTVRRLCQLQSDWISSWPPPDDAPFMNEPALIAGEEFEALIFNAVHGWYRQALGCLRNSLDILTIAAALASRADLRSFSEWRSGSKSLNFGNARELIRDSAVGKKLDSEALPRSIFGNDNDAWMKTRYSRLCAYSHGQAGHNNGAIWKSNGPVFVTGALELVEAGFRETLALAYLLLAIAWTNYRSGAGPKRLMEGPFIGWEMYVPVARSTLLT